MGDDEFLASEFFSSIPGSAILGERRWLAQKLGLAYEKLTPELKLGELAALDFLPGGAISIALGDLEFELRERFPSEQIPALESDLAIGAVVAWLADRR